MESLIETMLKINYKRFAMIAICIVVIMLTGRLVLNSIPAFLVSGLIAATWGIGLYIHLDRLEKKKRK